MNDYDEIEIDGKKVWRYRPTGEFCEQPTPEAIRFAACVAHPFEVAAAAEDLGMASGSHSTGKKQRKSIQTDSGD